MFKEYEVIKLTRDISKDLPKGSRGTILIVYNEPTLPKAYEIEFLDKEGRTIAILTLNECDIAHEDNKSNAIVPRPSTP